MMLKGSSALSMEERRRREGGGGSENECEEGLEHAQLLC